MKPGRWIVEAGGEGLETTWHEYNNCVAIAALSK